MNKSIQYILILALTLSSCDDKRNNSDVANEITPNETSNKQIIDLSHVYSDETIYWVTAKEFELDTIFKGQTDKGFYYSANNFSTAEHGGTHIDAPIHFAKNGQSVEEIPLEKLIGKAIKIFVQFIHLVSMPHAQC